MKRLLRRLFRQTDDWDQTPGVAALPHLVQTAEPDPDLFSRIEARIDAASPVRSVQPAIGRRRAAMAGLLTTVAIISAALGYFAGPDRQRIVARPAATADWVPLGSVSLHGPALRAFVRGKCRGHTHFYILMYGASVSGTGPGPGTPLAENGEKILMECIF